MPGPYDLDRAGLAALLEDEPAYRVDQVWRALYAEGRRPGQMTNLPRPVRARLDGGVAPGVAVALGAGLRRRTDRQVVVGPP